MEYFKNKKILIIEDEPYGQGRDVLGFWVYEIRYDLDNCANRIKKRMNNK